MGRPRSVLRFTGLLMLGALLGKAFGFVREIMLAKHLGADVAADGLRGAMTAVLMPIAPLQGDLLPSTLVPLFQEWREEGRSSRMMSSLCLVFMAVAAALAVLIACFAEGYVGLLVSGFGPEAKAVTVAFTRIMVLAMPASVLVACLGCAEVALGRSRMTSIRASVQNVSVIVGIAAMTWTGEVSAIAWAFTAGMVLVALYGLAMLWREGELSPFDVRIGSGIDAAGTFLHRARPLLFQPFADQGNTVLEKLLASTLAVGTMASLDYARTITDTVYYVVSQPVGLIVLGQGGGAADLRDRVRLIALPLLHLALPASAFLLTFSADIVTLVFGRGAFGAEAVGLTATSMRGISVGLWATTLGWILVRMLNAQRRNVTAAKVLACAYLGNMATSLATFSWCGSFGIGLGEAVKGVVLLAGTAYALGCAGLLARLAAGAVPVTLAVGAAGLLVHAGFGTPLGRVLAGAGLYAAVLVPWFLFFVPELAQRVRKPRPTGKRIGPDPIAP